MLPISVAGQAAQVASHAMVASNSTLASEAGVEVLKRGGNAVDAAVATGFALAVTLPSAGNLGGGGYMVIRMSDGRSMALDYRETAPAAATRNMYIDSLGHLTSGSTMGYRAVAVPGSVAGLCEAERRYGRLTLRAVMAPAIRLAAEGFVVDSLTARVIASHADLIGQFSGRNVFLPGGKAPVVGSRLRQPALAQTLQQIAARGSAGFYRGHVATLIARDMAAHGGLITSADLAQYRPIWRTPVLTHYRGFTLIGMPLSSSGGLTMARFFTALDSQPVLPPRGSVAYAMLMTRTLRAAFQFRNTQLGDTNAVRREGTQTTHYSVVDKDGNAVSTTTTINSLFGAGAYVGAAGFFLNNEMDDFAAQPGTQNQFGLVMGEANAIAPGKRPLSSMSPTIVLDSARQLRLVVGAAGGPRIITSTAEVALNVIGYDQSLADAMRAPRVHEQALPDTLYYEPNAFTALVLDSLQRADVAVAPTKGVGVVDAVMRIPGGYAGMDDPRLGAAAVGY